MLLDVANRTKNLKKVNKEVNVKMVGIGSIFLTQGINIYRRSIKAYLIISANKAKIMCFNYTAQKCGVLSGVNLF